MANVVIDTPIRPRTRSGKTWEHELPSQPWVEPDTTQEFLDTLIGGSPTWLYTSRDKRHTVVMPELIRGGKETRNAAAFKFGTASLAVQAAYQSYAAHVPYSFRPDTFWYMIVHEVAVHVRRNPGKYASLFTETPDAKQTITIWSPAGVLHDPNHWVDMTVEIRAAIEEYARLRDTALELFLPRFTTTTTEEETALLVAFLDVVSSYYGVEYRLLCGIPQIRLEGEASDWRALYDCTTRLASTFGGLKDYFVALLPVLEKVAETAAGTTPDDAFWRSFFQYDGGCGDPSIGGWITSFFAHYLTSKGMRPRTIFDLGDWRSEFNLAEFPSHISKVPVTFTGSGIPTPIPGVFAAGITGVDYDDTFLTPRLGYAVAAV